MSIVKDPVGLDVYADVLQALKGHLRVLFNIYSLLSWKQHAGVGLLRRTYCISEVRLDPEQAVLCTAQLP